MLIGLKFLYGLNSVQLRYMEIIKYKIKLTTTVSFIVDCVGIVTDISNNFSEIVLEVHVIVDKVKLSFGNIAQYLWSNGTTDNASKQAPDANLNGFISAFS